MVKDGWTDIAQRIRDRVIANGGDLSPATMRRAYEDSDDEKMTEIRARVDDVVKDRATAEALKPWYRQLCKRPCFHDEYLETYNLPNVHLVDTHGRGVDRIDESGLWVDGRHYELDCLIFASGFEVGTGYARRSAFDVVGRDGLSLSQRWDDGMQSLHGIHVHGFPNLFVVGVTHAANLISNVTHNLTEAATTIAAVIARTIAAGDDEVEVSADAERAWMTLLKDTSESFLADPECTPGYYNNEGRPMGAGDQLNSSRYPEGPVAYFEYIDAWRNAGDFEHLEFRKRTS
jgi:cation diffusion facilitator CzcD-associated flavoprotein CzcO